MSEPKSTNSSEADQLARYATEQQEAAVKNLQQRQEAKTTELNKEEILRIASLPTQKMRIGNVIQEVICDEVTGFIYYVNPEATSPLNRLLGRRTPYSPERLFAQQEAARKKEEDEDDEEETEEDVQQKARQDLQARRKDRKEKTEEKKKGNEQKVKKEIFKKENKGEEQEAEEQEESKSEAVDTTKTEKADKNASSPSRFLQKVEQSLNTRKKRRKQDGSLKKKVFAFGLTLALIAVGVCAAPVMREQFNPFNPSPSPVEPATPTPSPTPTPAPSTVDSGASIVQVVHDLIPGDVITEEDLREANISTETYNQITLQGINLYQWSRYHTLVGMYVQTYLPAGQYVSFSSVGAAYQPPMTLWMPKTYLDLPLTEEQQATADYIPGEKVNVIIRKQIVQEEPVTQGTTEAGQGGTATTIVQTTTIEEYSLPNTTICDVFTGESASDSLYQELHALSAVSAGEQVGYIQQAMRKESFADRFHEKTVRIYVNPEDMEAIGAINNLDKVTISIEKTGEFSKDTDERASFVASAQATMKNIQSAKQAIQNESTSHEPAASDSTPKSETEAATEPEGGQ